MPIRLYWKVGMTWQLRSGRLARLRLAEAEEAWMRQEVSPKWDVGECGSMLHTGAEGVTYMSLAPVSTIALSEMARQGGAGLQLGVEVKVLFSREVLTLLFLEIIKLVPRADPRRQVMSSQPWFLVAPGPAGFVLVVVSTCLIILFLQVLLEWRWRTPNPWEEQNLPTIQRFFIDA